MDTSKFFQSPAFKIGLWCLIGLIIIFLVFQAGLLVGFRKADFSCRWGDNYQRNFGGPRGGMFGQMPGGDFFGAHGVDGQILKIDLSTATSSVTPNLGTITVKGRDNVERLVIIREKTIIEQQRATLKISDLKINDSVVIIGTPNQNGQIDAQFVRIMPVAPQPLTK
ncbi:MAG: hypothetical protein V1763_03145 [Parcubacteria group bacterium]